MKISSVEFYKQSGNTNKNSKQNNRQSFSGASDMAFNALDKFFVGIDKNAMIQVSLIDSVATIIPRTIIDLKTSLAASLETFRRESSGLFVNCLLPGVLVKGIAEILPKSPELKGTGAASSWANEDSIEKLKEVYKYAQKSGAENKNKEFVISSLNSLSGLDGTKWVRYAGKSETLEFKNAVSDVTNAISETGNERDNLLKKAREQLAKITKAENILKFDGKPQANLEETLRDIADLGSKFNKVKENEAKKLGKNTKDLSTKEIETAIDRYSKSLVKFVDKKSAIGLAIVIGIAVSMQTINRAITRKQFKTEGAPIYKDFGKKDTVKKMNKEEKKSFWSRKLIAAGGMFGLAVLSMMKKPTKQMFQFSGIFPTLDQCRWVAASTFASRMLAAEDDNELRETTVRDLASFAGLYFLGDYAKKTAASGIEALSKTETGKKLIGEEVVLLNRKNGKNRYLNKWQQFKDWVKQTDLKTANEVSNKKVRNLRNLCRVADIAFSIALLGIWLPMYNRKVTEKKVAQAKQSELASAKSISNFSSFSQKNTPAVFKNIIKN